jgi:hypothetical protein
MPADDNRVREMRWVCEEWWNDHEDGMALKRQLADDERSRYSTAALVLSWVVTGIGVWFTFNESYYVANNRGGTGLASSLRWVGVAIVAIGIVGACLSHAMNVKRP